jgi:RNA polymerase sigma factor (sigma-70 family)
MEVPYDDDSMDDAELVAAAAAGDRAAFATIYDAHADRVYDVCCTILGDRDEAADVMQDTFILAARHIGSLRDPSRLRPWLLAIARHEAIRRGRKRARAVPTDRVEAMSDTNADDDVAGSGVGADEARALVAAAADGLSERDRAILALHLRQGLEGQDLADALGVSLAQSYVLMSRLRDQIDRSLGALLVARDGAGECGELGEMLRGWDGTYTPLIRKRVARHVDRCEICTVQRRTKLPLALAGAIPFVAAPAYAREAVLTQMELATSTSPPRGWSDDGFPPELGAGHTGRRRALELVVAAVVALAVLIAGATGVRELEARRDSPEAASSSSAPTSTTVPAPGATTPSSTTTLPSSSGPTTAPTTPVVTIATTVPATPPPTIPPASPTVSSVSWSPKQLSTEGCPDSVLSVAAAVTGTSLTSVRLDYVDPTGTKASAAMAFDGTQWVTKLGPFGKPGSLTFTVVAIDSAGQTATSNENKLAVTAC